MLKRPSATPQRVKGTEPDLAASISSPHTSSFPFIVQHIWSVFIPFGMLHRNIYLVMYQKLELKEAL